MSAAILTVASLNMHCGVSALGRPFDVQGAMESLDADVLALQEVWSPDAGPDAVAVAARALGASVHRQPLRKAASLRALGVPVESGPGSSGMTVVSRLPVIGYEVADLGQLRGDVVRRRAQILTLELPGGSPMRLVSTHLTHRLVSPVQLGALVRRLDGARLPTVIAGDLNMPGLLAGRARGYSMAVRGRTWPAELPALQLDHILANAAFARLGGQVLRPAGSDHLPVRACLQLRGRW